MNHIEKQAKAVISGYLDTMIFYLCEYGNYDQSQMEMIANVFCEEYKRVFFRTVSELLEDVENEG